MLVGHVVSTSLYNVDFTRCRPWTVCVVNRQHPDGGPKPVTDGKLRDDLDTSVLDLGGVLGSNAAGPDGVDDGAVCGVGDGMAVVPASITAALGGKIEGVVVVDERSILESGLNVQLTVLDEDVLFRVGSLLELTIAKGVS